MHVPEKADEPRSPGRRKLLKAFVGVAAAGGLVGGSGWFVLKRGRNLFEVRREQTLMQTSVAITCLADDVDKAGVAIDAAFQRMASTVAVLTRFDPAGPVARLNRDGRLENLPPELRDVLHRSLAISAVTDGDFDISVLPVLEYFESMRQPAVLDAGDRVQIGERDHLINYRRIALDAQGVRFTHPGMSVTLDGLAKGYVIDQGIASLRESGIEDALVDAGGDLRAISGSDFNRQWHIGIVDPGDINKVAAVVTIRNAALGTSGNYRIFYSSDKTLFHVINPHTGYSPLNYSSVTVMAETSVDADAMSVAAASMPVPRLREVMASQNDQWLVFSRDGSRSWRSKDLPQVSGNPEVV
ncbi:MULTISPECIES: FAD:protein FMN transferase [unclassified Rhodanobacter]|uniref:FAD:protein FMN transferase n=1 Tax=unclassified Rhodanobacter TaxID=2621553 RepID=UPI0009846985|nr:MULTISPECIES: FAD:protein FMN transferase [unclassified Rhodanobacter]OOG38713.1 thiamine biosynthesis protein ApbE [Rhodanobacter sp. C05]OOG50311.1 thiamine biosynthesis protein ApbE [Rhodanobacter sp. C01]OOG52338.1 thiamine biosynthesis protein ApbE [Rhodanobacter sp. C03]